MGISCSRALFMKSQAYFQYMRFSLDCFALYLLSFGNKTSIFSLPNWAYTAFTVTQ